MSPTFQKIEPVSKKTRVVTMLREAIVSGAIPRGEQIVEGKLAQQLGVGQGLVREALIELEHQGFVQRTPFSGTNVSTMTLEDAKQIFEMRIELEPLAFFLAAKNADDRDLADLKELAGKTVIAFEAQDLDGFFESHLNFRKKIWRLAGNKFVQQALERVVIPLYALYLVGGSYDREGLTECLEHQEKVLEAVHRKDSDGAKREAGAFLSKTKEYLGTRLIPQK